MGKSTKSKWILGLTGTAFSAFVISQIGANQSEQSPVSNNSKAEMMAMSAKEKALYQLDWSSYSINGTELAGAQAGGVQSDRQTRRS